MLNDSSLKDTSDINYFKLQYIGNLSHHIKNKRSKLCKEFCKENVNVRLVFTSFNIKNYFSYKDQIRDDLKSFLVYKFTCARCSSRYIGETCSTIPCFTLQNVKISNSSCDFDTQIFRKLKKYSFKSCILQIYKCCLFF